MTRRGAFAAYLDIDHPDFEEFLQIRDIGNPIQNLFTGACIPDYWMQEMVDGDMEKRRIWAKVLESRQQKGLPYLFFTDNVNKNKPQVYKDKKMQITHSNLCFTGDTKVFTNIAGENKEISFESLYSKFGKGEGLEDLKVWCKDDGEIKQVGVKEVMLVGYTSELTRLTFDGEYTVECTPDHRFLLDSGDYKEAQYLTPEDKLASSGAYGLNEVEAVSIKENQLIQLQEKVPVYCLEVLNDSHNFLLSIDNQGVIVSNCSEIALIDSESESFVCCLSSLNLELYDEWKNTDTVKLAIYFLDAVMSEFIENSAGIPGLEAVNKFARRHRALGLGVLGYHSYLQRNNIPFESMEAKTFNAKVFKEIESKARKASKELAKVYGEPELLKGYGLRNTTLMAIAPTTSSSAILGQTSPGVEPFASNYYKAGLAKGNFMRKNKYLEAKLEELGKNTEEVWRDIMLNRGSVQHLDFLDDHTKAVFRTFKEISQREIITQAVQRQRYIDQAQSINLNIPPDIPLKDVNALYIYAWQSGLKTLYYQRSESVAKNMAMNFNNCTSCEA